MVCDKVLPLLVFLQFLFTNVYTQFEQPARLELTVENYETYECINAENRGLFLVRESKDLKNRVNNWQVINVDTSLNVIEENTYEFSWAHHYLKKTYHNGKAYLLFANYEEHNLEAISFDKISGDTSSIVIWNPFAFRLVDFQVTDRAILLGGYFKDKPFVLHKDLITKQVRVVPGLYIGQSDLIQLKVNKDSSFDVLVSELNSNKLRSIVIRHYSPQGDLVFETRIDPPERSLLDGRSITLSDGRQLITGAYTVNRSEYSRGLFVAIVELQGDYQIQYYNYANLENFFNYMKERRQKRVLKRIKRRKIKGKKLKFKYRMLVQDLIPHKDNFLLLGEAYYNKYSSRYSGAYRFGWSLYGNPTYLEGYQYTHAVIIGFDKEGKLVWDNSFEINDVLSQELEQYVYANSKRDHIVLIYKFEGRIKSKVIQENEVLAGKQDMMLRLTYEGDRLKSTTKDEGGLEHWYGDNYYAYGIQRIRNLVGSGLPLNRKVFFVNKITYR